jgi:Mn-dependent DtxR family transcriptional regulator
MFEQTAITVGENRDAVKFFGLFVQQEDQGFFLGEVSSFLRWQEEIAERVIKDLERQDLVTVRNGVVQLTSRGKRVFKELTTRRKL